MKKRLSHHCHLPGCKTATAPRMLFCLKHWKLVPKDLQREVERTVKMRDPHVNSTWVDWWRAQVKATAHVMRIVHPDRDLMIKAWEVQQEKFAKTLEKKS